MTTLMGWLLIVAVFWIAAVVTFIFAIIGADSRSVQTDRAYRPRRKGQR